MKLANFLFWVLAIHYIGVFAVLPTTPLEGKGSEAGSELVTAPERQSPSADSSQIGRISKLVCLPEFEWDTPIFVLRNTIFKGTRLHRPIQAYLNYAFTIIPSLDTLTMLYPFHSFP